MNNYKHFNFRNFVAIEVFDDFFIGAAMGFWLQVKMRERRLAWSKGLVEGYQLPCSVDGWQKLNNEINPSAFERTMEELLPLMEEGLIVIGESGDFRGEKTSYGYAAVKQPAGNVYDAIVAARAEFQKDQKTSSNFGWSWMIQATTKGWDWAKDRKEHMDLALYNEEQEHFFGLKLRN